MSSGALYRIVDTQSLMSAIESCSQSGQFTTNNPTRRHIIRRARALGRYDLIPGSWKQPTSEKTPKSTDFSEKERSAANTALQSKADEAGIDVRLLQSVYVRGIQEFTELEVRPPELVDRDSWAQARVNSFMRAYNGDPATRDSDYDLLNP